MPDNNNGKESDLENKKKEPDTAALKKVARDLFGFHSLQLQSADKTIKPESIDKVDNSDSTKKAKKPYIRVPISGPIDPEDGRMIITYTTDINRPDRPYTIGGMNPMVSGLSYDGRGMEALERTHREIEAVANVKFVHVDGSDMKKARESNIRYLVANLATKKGGIPGMEELIIDNGHEISQITIDRHVLSGNYLSSIANKQPGYNVMLHETMHALGFSHPGAKGLGEDGGRNPDYSTAETVMSYNVDGLTVEGLGPLDVPMLQLPYGAPDPKTVDNVIDENEITETSTLYSLTPATIDLRDEKKPSSIEGQIIADLSSDDAKRQFTGGYYSPHKPIQLRVAKGLKEGATLEDAFSDDPAIDISGKDTEIKDVFVDDGMTLNIIGNDLENHFIGGNYNDTMRPRGGSDTMTGGKGRNTYEFDGQSGVNNVITDFKISSNDGGYSVDQLRVDSTIKNVAVTFDVERQAPKIEFRGADDELIADVSLPGLNLIEARQQASATSYIGNASGTKPTLASNTKQDKMFDALEQAGKQPDLAINNDVNDINNNARPILAPKSQNNGR